MRPSGSFKGSFVLMALGLAALAACSKRDPAASSERAAESSAAPTAVPAPSAPITPAEGGVPADGQLPHGAPKQDAELGKEARGRFQKALNEGRALQEKKSYEGAVKAFQEALAIAPDDPRALSELGWAAFHAKNLDLAEASTKKALERATEPYLKASSHYTMGRIQEERGRKEEAIASYRRSLEHRFDKAVKERLAKLDPAAAAAFDVLGIAPLKGPFTSLDMFCEALKKRALPEKVRCDPNPSDLGGAYRGPSRLPKPEPPYLAVRVLPSSQGLPGEEPPAIGEGQTAYHLAIRTKFGWSVAEEAMATYNPGAFGITENVEVKELALRDAIPGGAPELMLRATHYHGDSNMGINELEEYTDEGLRVCGIGPSEKPSCTRPIPVAWSEHIGMISPEMEEPGMKHNLKDVKGSLTVTFLPSGQLEITTSTQSLPEAIRGLPGKHSLRFP